MKKGNSNKPAQPSGAKKLKVEAENFEQRYV